MTHFRTYCIGDYDEEELDKKYYEGTDVPEYCTGEVTENDIISFVTYYTQDKQDSIAQLSNLIPLAKTLLEKYKTNESQRQETFEKITKELFEPIYEKKGYDWNGNTYRKDENGIWKGYSTYNVDAVYDYFSEVKCTPLSDIEHPVETLMRSSGIFKNNQYYNFENVIWFGLSTNEKSAEEKEKIVRNLLEGVSPDTPIYMFDCHI